MINLYIDPGTGSLIMQFLIAIIAGIALFYKRIVYVLLKTFVPKRLEKKINKQDED